MNKILNYLKIHGEQSDQEIAKAVGGSLAEVRHQLSELSSKGEIMSCKTIRFEKGKEVAGVSCRLVGFIPRAAPGRKAK